MTPLPRLVVAGASSGAGKTTVTVALARALRARGLKVALFKCGPDYLDPTYHARAVGSPSQNLDAWMMGREAVLTTFTEGARGADLAIIEGMMGLFDGAEPTSDAGSTAEIAKWLGAPVALVVDASGMARSLRAVVHGFASFDPAVRVGGVVANRIGGRGHLELLRAALGDTPLLGGLPVDAGHAFAERHLGLRTADEESVPETYLEHWGALGAEWLDLDRALALARSAPALDAPEARPSPPPAPVCRVGVARDAAFHFYYADNLRRLEALGAEVVPFSPIADGALPRVDGLYIGGGYPELHARALSENAPMREAVRAFAAAGGPVYAECGGLMYLARAIVAANGERHAMAGVLPADVQMRTTLQAIGYVEVEVCVDTPVGAAGTRVRGHQFRYSELAPTPGPPAVALTYAIRRRHGGGAPLEEGYRVNNVIASYVHAHWASSPDAPAAFVRACASYGAGNCCS
jgi:cobyrinic acid a,c-diamide synthase